MLFLLTLIICVGFPGGLVAQEHGKEHGEEHDGMEGEHEEGHGEEHEHKNHIALFIGSTQAEDEHGERDDPQFTLGLDYERRLTRIFGLGALLDVVVEGHREAIVGVAGVFHAGRAEFVVAPAGERVRDTGDWEAVVRLGFLFEFEAGRVALKPSLYYDETEEGGTLVLGLTISKGF